MSFKFKTVNWLRLSIQWGIVFFILSLVFFPELLKKTTTDFVSHISNDGGIVEFKTRLDSTFREVAEIIYIDTITNPENIKKILQSDSLTVTYTDGTVGKVKNMFGFSEIIQKQEEVDLMSKK